MALSHIVAFSSIYELTYIQLYMFVCYICSVVFYIVMEKADS